MFWIDIAIISLTALCAIIGLAKGSFKSLVSFFSWTLTIVVTFFITGVVAKQIITIPFITEKVFGQTDSLFAIVLKIMPENAGDGFLGKFFEPMFAQANSLSAVAGYENLTAVQGVALSVTYKLFSLMVGIALFIALRIVIALIMLFIKSFSSGEKPSAVSRLGGFVIGAARGFCYSVIILLFFHYAMALPFMTPVGAEIDKSIIGRPLYEQVSDLADKFVVKDDEETLKFLVDTSGILNWNAPVENLSTAGNS